MPPKLRPEVAKEDSPPSPTDVRATETREQSDSLDDSPLNSIALSKPIVPQGRRRPSQVANLISYIPAENRLTTKDFEAVSSEDSSFSSGKRSHDNAFSEADLSPTEKWLLSKLTLMEKDLMNRIASLESENIALRKALVQAKISIPGTDPVPDFTSYFILPTAVSLTKKPAPLPGKDEPEGLNDETMKEHTSSRKLATISETGSPNTSSRRLPPVPEAANSPKFMPRRTSSDFSSSPVTASPTANRKVPVPPQRTSSASLAPVTPLESELPPSFTSKIERNQADEITNIDGLSESHDEHPEPQTNHSKECEVLDIDGAIGTSNYHTEDDDSELDELL